jgi:hypothetical protein
MLDGGGAAYVALVQVYMKLRQRARSRMHMACGCLSGGIMRPGCTEGTSSRAVAVRRSGQLLWDSILWRRIRRTDVGPRARLSRGTGSPRPHRHRWECQRRRRQRLNPGAEGVVIDHQLSTGRPLVQLSSIGRGSVDTPTTAEMARGEVTTGSSTTTAI